MSIEPTILLIVWTMLVFVVGVAFGLFISKP